MRLYIIRHADPDYENDTITPAGHLEAQALSVRLKGEGINKIFCSPAGRAQRQRGVKVGRTPRIRRVPGPPGPVTDHAVRATHRERLSLRAQREIPIWATRLEQLTC